MPLVRPLCPGLWEATDRMPVGGMVWPVRTVIAAVEGRLWIHSPVALSEPLAAEVSALGEVAWLVAPNLLHHVHLRAWAERWPRAEVWAPPGLEAKEPGLRIDHRLPDDATPFGGVLAHRLIEGAPAVHEVVFLHRPSRTLIAGDLLFHIDEPEGLMTRIVLFLVGALRRPAMSRSWRLFIKDRARAAQSVREILAWDFDRVVMAHGRPLDTGGKAVVEEQVRWLLKAAPRALAAPA